MCAGAASRRASHGDVARRAGREVLLLTASLGGGGAEKHVVRIANHLDRRRFRVTVAVARGGGAYERDLADDVGYQVLTGKHDPRSSTGRTLLAIPPLRRLIRELRPAVVFSALDPINVAMLATVHSLPQSQRPRTVVSIQNPPSVAHGRGSIVGAATLSLMRRTYGSADGVVAISRAVADDLVRVVPRLAGRVSRIFNCGFDPQVLEDARLPLPPDLARPTGPLLVACGRLTEQKGFPVLLEALAHVRRSIPATLWIVGEGPLRPVLERRVVELGLADAVRLLGFQANPYRIMAAADVFALSSLWEGFGNVVVEAMACGCPVVATRCEGPSEILREGIDGLLVPPGDAGALADGILRLLCDPELRATMARSAAGRSQAFSAEEIAAEHAALFQDLLAGGEG